MKLYEAIRLGSMMHKQGFGRSWSEVDFPTNNPFLRLVVTKTCAMGAAYKADSLSHVIWSSLVEDNSASCPACSIVFSHLPIVHLNDIHSWTREAIADWLEPIEEEWLAKSYRF